MLYFYTHACFPSTLGLDYYVVLFSWLTYQGIFVVCSCVCFNHHILLRRATLFPLPIRRRFLRLLDNLLLHSPL